MNPQIFRGGLEFNSSTTYSKEYSNLKGKSASKARPPDQFSMTGSWLGSSSYRQQYQNPKNHVSSRKETKGSNKSLMGSQKSVELSSFGSPSAHFSSLFITQKLHTKRTILRIIKRFAQQPLSSATLTWKKAATKKTLTSKAWTPHTSPLQNTTNDHSSTIIKYSITQESLNSCS